MAFPHFCRSTSQLQLLLLGMLFEVKASPPVASDICVYNAGKFLLKWKLVNVDTGDDQEWTSNYVHGEVNCLTAVDATWMGARLQLVVQADFGKTFNTTEPVVYDPSEVAPMYYVCQGVALNFSCSDAEPAPLPEADAVNDVSDFSLGFVKGLSLEIVKGFAECFENIRKTYQDILSAVDLFEHGINGKTVDKVKKAFGIVGKLILDIATAIGQCLVGYKEVTDLMFNLGSKLVGGVMGPISVVVGPVVHITLHAKEITAECITTVSDWRAGDFMGSGLAVGKIVGMLLKAISMESSTEIAV